ncbi:MAG: AI-2E family transporter [Desulfovibrio sp.]|nr:AI-2E family transporter [Desulfovibrio sp.]
MTLFRTRLFYVMAVCCCLLLLLNNPITLFLAGCFSCLSLPIYKRFKIKAERIRLRSRLSPRMVHFLRHTPMAAYIAALLIAVIIPISILILLVAPQAGMGLDRLRELQANNFQLPQEWVQYIQGIRDTINSYPKIGQLIDDAMKNVDSLFAEGVSILVSRGFGFLGGTMSALWTTFLFFTLTFLFSFYSRSIGLIFCRIFNTKNAQMRRFVLSIHNALRAIMLGIILVAIIQGILCGLGFYVAGVKQPAFWGMLATLVAPIPFIGTALVWLPLCISLWFTGKTFAAIGLAIWGAIAVAGIDSILRPLFLKKGIRAPFFVLILAILCGTTVFGAVGLIAGPVLLAFILQLIAEANSFYDLAK